MNTKNHINAALVDELVGSASRTLMQVRLRRPYWNGRIGDEAAAQELCEAKGSKAGAASVRKQVVDPSHLAGIGSIRSRAYKTFMANSLTFESPWMVVPVTSFPSLMLAMEQAADELAVEVEGLVAKRDLLVAEAMRNLNGLYVDGIVPSADDLRACYGLRFEFRPVMDASGTKLDAVENGLREAAVASYQQQVRESVAGIITEWFSRAEAMLAKYEADVVSPTAKVNVLADNVRETVASLRSLNLWGDTPAFTTLLAKMDALADIDAKRAKGEAGEAKQKAARGILASLAKVRKEGAR